MGWIEDIFKNIGNLINSVKSLLAFYILMYLLPIVVLIVLINNICPYLLINNKTVNYPVLYIIIGCVIAIMLWTVFILLYLTQHRTKYPRLYGRGFVAGIEESPHTSNSVKPTENEEESDNYISNNQNGGKTCT